MLLLDEPLGALDLKLRKGLQVQLKQIQRDVGITFVYVTHDQEEALTMSDRIAVMNHGRIEQVADPEQVYDKPASTFVAGFIGVSNLMPGVVKKEGTSGEVLLDSGRHDRGERRGLRAGRPLPRGGSAREAEAGRRRAQGPERRGSRRELALPRHRDPDARACCRTTCRLTVLVPNADEAERQKLPGGGAKVKLSWAPDHMHLVHEIRTEERH